MNNDEVTITFLGDLMCDGKQLSLIECGAHTYDEIFEDVRCLLSESDYVVGNLETPIASLDLGYTTIPAYFNTPVGFAAAVKKTGVDFVTTANNHCWDRGLRGLNETLRNLDSVGLQHTGTYISKDDASRISVIDISGVSFAFVAGTYGINLEDARPNAPRDVLDISDEWRIDLLRKTPEPLKQVKEPASSERNHSHRYVIKCIVKSLLPRRLCEAISVYRNGLPPQVSRQPDTYWSDCVHPNEIHLPENEKRLSSYLAKIAKAKDLADIVVAMPHIGGQYNLTPGGYHEYVVAGSLRAGADLVVAGHSHNPQPAMLDTEGRLVVNSLGNFCFTPYLDWYVYNICAEYGLVLTATFSRSKKKLIRYRFDYVKNIVMKDGFAKPVPVSCLIDNEKDDVARERLILETRFVKRIVEGVYDNN